MNQETKDKIFFILLGIGIYFCGFALGWAWEVNGISYFFDDKCIQKAQDLELYVPNIAVIVKNSDCPHIYWLHKKVFENYER